MTNNTSPNWLIHLEDARVHLAHAIGCLKQASYQAPDRHEIILNRLIKGLAGARRLLAATKEERT